MLRTLSQGWGYRCVLSCPASTWVLGTRAQTPVLVLIEPLPQALMAESAIISWDATESEQQDYGSILQMGQ